MSTVIGRSVAVPQSSKQFVSAESGDIPNTHPAQMKMISS